ncbi:MAG: nuclear transport factor 2 family protein [Pseudomonadota bacterium]
MHTPEEMMQIGSKLVELCNNGQDTECLNQLYAENAVSVEGAPMPDGSAEAAGLDAIRGKHEWWYANHEVHSSKAEGPFVHGGDRFNVIFEMDVTQKENGERMQMREVATYHVKDGKIVREEFAYPMG